MLKAKCIGKIRDKNNYIIGYTITGADKKTISVKSDALKRAIRSGQIDVINLTLTSDNRLIDKKPDTPSKSTTTPSKPTTTYSKPTTTPSKTTTTYSKQNVESMINAAKTVGYTVYTFDTACGHKCYIASSPDNTTHLFIIPDDVKYIYETDAELTYVKEEGLCSYMSNIKGTLKVIGGKNLISTMGMFLECKAQYIDLRSFDTSNVTYMRSMFHSCEAQSIDFSLFNTSEVTDMSCMFEFCKTQSLDLRSFNTSRVENMYRMFSYCGAQSINLSSFNTSNVTDMYNMFMSCKAKSIDLSSFNTSKVTSMKYMFIECKAQIKVNDPKLKAQLQRDRE